MISDFKSAGGWLRWLAIWIFVAVHMSAMLSTAIAGGNMRQTFNADIPEDLVAAQGPDLLMRGYLDVSRPPYNADRSGAVDATQALQRAVDDAYRFNLVTWFPKGTYLVSDQITMIQKESGLPGLNIGKSQRKYANILQGDSSGGSFPIIKLADRSRVRENTLLVFKYVLDDGTEQASRHYNGALRGLAIDLGDNPQVTGVRFSGAQYCVIEDVEIFGTAFNIGVDGIPGSGGGVTNLSVAGGNVGVRQDDYRPTPQITGLTIVGPKTAGVVLRNSMGPLTIVGMDYRGPAPSITVRGGAPATNLNLVDARLEITAPDVPAVINANRDTYLRNVYVRADTVFAGSSDTQLQSDPQGWAWIEEFAAIRNPTASIIANGRPVAANGDYKVYGNDPKAVAEAPNPLLPHIWDVANFPSHASQLMLDPVSFGATPDDDQDDDAPAINDALRKSAETGQAVFLPRGHWHIRSPITVPGGAALVGASNTMSVIHVAEDWRPDGPTAAVTTEDGEKGVVLSHFAILGQQATERTGTTAHRYISLLHGQSANSIVRGIQLSFVERWKADLQLATPIVRFSGQMGGRVFTLALDSGWRHHEGGLKEDQFAIVDIVGTTNPLALYQLDTEQLTSAPQLRITDAQNISVYGYKHEPALSTGENHALMHVTGSRNLSFIGSAGIYTLKKPDDAIVKISDSRDFVFANWSRNPRHGLPNDRKGRVQFNWIEDEEMAVPAAGRSMGVIKQGSSTAFGELAR